MGNARRAQYSSLGLGLTLLLAAACTPAGQGTSQPSANSAQPRQGNVLRVATLGPLPTILHPYPQPQDNSTALSSEGTVMGSGLIDLDYNTLDFVADPRRSLAKALP